MRRILLAAVLLSTLTYAQQPTPPQPVTHPAFPTGDTTPLGSKIATVLADPTVSRAHWGIAVTALDGTPIYGFDEGKLFRPASNAKLFTTAAAMALLGSNDTSLTVLYAEGGKNMSPPRISGAMAHWMPISHLRETETEISQQHLFPYLPPSQRQAGSQPMHPPLMGF